MEFGTSEVFYLEVRDKDRQRTAELSTAISRQLQSDLQDIRDAKARSMIEELEKAVQVAKTDLKAATAQADRLGNGGRQRPVRVSVALGLELQRHGTPPHGFGSRK